ncbi:MAG: hypothetical protein JWP27_1721 [Flaviaesturariibacter sp.]|nr:hypothetical protein [Flaviaesturariibacter sp.]
MRRALLSLTLLPLSLAAQVVDNFADGDFTTAPTWTGNTADWTVNAAAQLQSASNAVNASFFLSTPNTLAMETEWTFYAGLAFNTSSVNYVDVFLTASAPDLGAATTTGYFVRIGNSTDDISLYRKDPSSLVRLIDGADGTTNSSDNHLLIRVTRTGGVFRLFVDVSGTGQSLSLTGAATDGVFTGSGWFGFLVRQSTASFFQKHVFDEVSVRPFLADTVPPALLGATFRSPLQVDALFSEALDPGSGQSLLHYQVAPAAGFPALALLDAANQSLVHLSFPGPLPAGIDHLLAVNGISDLAGNVLTNGTASFRYDLPHRYDIVISEIMADPSPPNGLPDAEFIELKNRSGHALSLDGWRLSSASSSSGAFPFYMLPPDSFLVLTALSQVTRFPPGIRVLGVPSFPQFDNSGTTVSLASSGGQTIHAVAYTADWYDNDLKRDGGWSLEIIDPARPCVGQPNWKASTNPAGGTPGRANSVTGTVADQLPPRLLRSVSPDSLTVVALFDEPLDSLSASVTARYLLSGQTIRAATPEPPLFQSVSLRLAQPMAPRTVYELDVRDVTDCSGNAIGGFHSAKAGLPSAAGPGALVINEVLFDPRPGAFDYLEVYNAGVEIVDLSHIYLSNGTAGSVPRRLRADAYLLFPGAYVVLTEDPGSLGMQYFVKNPMAVMKLALPTLPDDKGRVLLLDAAGRIIDDLAYDTHWHFALITDPEGIALERLDPHGPTQSAANWHSAASTAGFGTPGYRNSQDQGNGAASVIVSPPVFSPDNDGRDDVLMIRLATEKPGCLANVTVFDAEGRIVRSVARNTTLGRNDVLTWDGLGENGRPLAAGIYVVFTEVYDLDGGRHSDKTAVVLVRPL